MKSTEMSLSDLSPPELLALHAKVAGELRTRGITRSATSPTRDLAEHLFCKSFGWKQAGNSQATQTLSVLTEFAIR